MTHHPETDLHFPAITGTILDRSSPCVKIINPKDLYQKLLFPSQDFSTTAELSSRSWHIEASDE